MAEIGKYSKLKVVREFDFGVYIDGENLGDILLPRNSVPKDTRVGDEVDVFIYLDSEDRIIATTEKPYATVGDFVRLEAVSVNNVGAFLDWGLSKDLLVPYHEQKRKMEACHYYIVKVYLDEKTNRIAASAKIDKFLGKEPVEFFEGQEVELMIYSRTDLGYKAIVNGSHWGVIYENEVFRELKIGQITKGFIKKVRPDDKIDLALNKPGFEKSDELEQGILDMLKENGGYLALTDKSSPEIIYEVFGESKKTFKKAVGGLYRKRLISIEEEGIRIAGEPD